MLTGKRHRYIGSENGFVGHELWLFESKKIISLINERGTLWGLIERILDKIASTQVIVIDNAPYPSRRQLLTNAWRKYKIQNWLQETNIYFDASLLRT